MANNKNFKVKNGLDVSGTVTAGGNLLATHSSLGYITKAEFEAMAEERKANRSGSGFDEWGKHYTSGMQVNEGMHTELSPNFLVIGRNDVTYGGQGISKTWYPVVNVNGVHHKFYGTNLETTALIKGVEIDHT